MHTITLYTQAGTFIEAVECKSCQLACKIFSGFLRKSIKHANGAFPAWYFIPPPVEGENQTKHKETAR